MARVFLDANTFIDALYRKPAINERFLDHDIYVSVLSTHMLFYALKIDVPNKIITAQLSQFSLIDLTSEILEHALQGPTKDMEDNIQLHSAAETECDVFLTSDKKLLSMTFFGKTKIAASL